MLDVLALFSTVVVVAAFAVAHWADKQMEVRTK